MNITTHATTHLTNSGTEWDRHKDSITRHSKVWSEFSQKAIQEEMTDFQILDSNRLVQSIQYGEHLKIVANFSEYQVDVEDGQIPAHSGLIIDGENKIIYAPTM